MKRKLFLLLCALLTMIGVQAQTDVTANYVGDLGKIINGGGHNHNSGNHKLSDSAYPTGGDAWWNDQTLSGWHAFAAPGTSGTGESWTPGFGSAGVMMGRTMVLPSGNYTLSFDAFGCNATNSTEPGTMPSAGDAVAFLTGKDNVDITNTAAAGDATFHNVSFTFDVTTDNTAFEFGIKKLTDGSKIDWCQIKNVKLMLNSTNIYSVPNNDVATWTYSGTQTWHTNTWSVEGNSDKTNFLTPFSELWVSSGGTLADATIKQSFTPTETGVYKVSAWVRALNESGGAISGAKIFVGDTEADACGGAAITNGSLGTFTAMADGVADTPFEYGFKLENATINWLSFKNVTITYLGEIPDAEVEALLAQVPSGKMAASVKTELDSRVGALESNASVANYNALASYIPTANTSKNIYETINTAINTYATMASSLDAAGQAAYDASTVQTKYDNGTYETLTEAEADLLAAYRVAVKAQTTNGADMTVAIVNPDFEMDDINTAPPTGWTCAQSTFKVAQGSQAQGGAFDGNVSNKYAYVRGNKIESLYQEISGLNNGKYVLTARAKTTDMDYCNLGLGGNTVAVLAGVTSDVAATYSVAYDKSTDTDVRISYGGRGSGNSGNGNYFVDDFSLAYYTDLPDVDISELAAKPMKTSVLSALNNASTAYAGSKTAANYNSLQNAIVNAQISAGIYSAYAAFEAKAVANLTAAGLESFNSNVTVAEYYNGTYDGTETQESAIKTAYVAVLKAYPVVGADFTDVITNPSFETGDLTDWTSSTMGAQGNKAFDRTDGNYYVESWHPAAEGEKNVSASVVGLPAGFYKLTVAAYADDVNSAKIFAKNGDTEYSTSVSTSNDYNVTLYYDGTSTFTIGYSADMKKDAGWVCVDNFRLNYYGTNDATCLIKDADCSSNDYWPGSGRTFDTKTDWTGTSRQVFSNNGTAYNRSQVVTFPLAGKYRLDVYGLIENETGFFEAKVGTTEKSQNYNQSLNHYIVANDGTESNTVKTSGNGWTIQEIYFDIANAGDEATIALRPSCGNGSGHTQYGYIGGLKLTYLGASGTLADMQVSATAKIGTFCAPYDTKVPARVTAHTVSQGSGDWIRLSDPLEDGIIPAGTPVILQAEDGIAVAIQKTYFGTDNVDPSDSYVLKGLYEAEEMVSGANPYYILQYVAEDGGAAFYRVPTGQTRNLAANRCYLQPENANNGARIAIGGEDDPTAINEIEVIESEAKTMKDGKYLVKGRIVIVKNGKAFGANGQTLK